MGNKDDRFVEERRSLLERFMKEIARFEYLTNSREFKVFARERGDIEKILTSMLKQSPTQILDKYRLHFQINENQDASDLARYKDNILTFQTYLKKAIPIMEIQKRQLKKMIGDRQAMNESYITLVQQFAKYEDNNIEYFAESDVTKKVYSNPTSGNDIVDKITQQWKYQRNPYKDAYYWLKGELLDLKGLRQALEGRENVVRLQSQVESKKRSDQIEVEKLS